MYDVWLNLVDPDFRTPEKMSDYLSFKRSDGNITLQIFVLVSCVVYVGTRYWFSADPLLYTHNPTALAAVMVAVPVALFLIVSVLLRLAALSFAFNLRMFQPYHESAVAYLASPRYGRLVDDGIVIGATLSVGLYLLATALAEACPPDATVFHMQGCNPEHEEHAIPAEVMVLAIVVVIVFQTVARGCSNPGLCVAWAIAVVCVNASLGIVRNNDYLWVNLELAFVMCLSYELERVPLRQFVKSVSLPLQPPVVCRSCLSPPQLTATSHPSMSPFPHVLPSPRIRRCACWRRRRPTANCNCSSPTTTSAKQPSLQKRN
jgi:hypothetical protein